MIFEIEKKFTHLEDLRLYHLKKIELLSNHQLHFKPSSISWSINEVLHHLYLAEHGTLQYINKKLQSPKNLYSTKFKNIFSSWLMTVMLNSPMKFKLPKGAPIIPHEEISFGDLIADWNLLRKSWITTLDIIDVETANKLIFKHPRAGYLNVFQVIAFMESHFNHHVKQIERIKNDLNFPQQAITEKSSLS